MSSLDTKQFLPSPYSPIFLTPFVIYHPNPKGHSNGQLYPLLRLMSGTIARFGTFEYQLERTRFIRHPKWLNGDLMYVNNISNRTRHLANRKSGRFSPYDTAPGWDSRILSVLDLKATKRFLPMVYQQIITRPLLYIPASRVVRTSIPGAIDMPRGCMNSSMDHARYHWKLFTFVRQSD